MDSYIKEVAENQRRAGRLGVAWAVEQAVQSLGLQSYFMDENGDGPFIQEIKNY